MGGPHRARLTHGSGHVPTNTNPCPPSLSVPTLRPKERSRVRFEILPTRSGTKQLLADFSCNKFPAIKAMLSIDVAE